MVEIDSWVAAEGKNGMRRDFLVRDYTTGEVIARATRCVIWEYQFLFSFETIIWIIRDTVTDELQFLSFNVIKSFYGGIIEFHTTFYEIW